MARPDPAPGPLPLPLVVPAPLTTERLALRRWVVADEPAFARVYGDPAVHRYLYSAVGSPDQLAVMFERRLVPPSVAAPGAVRLAVVERATGEVVGEALLMVTDVEHRGGEVGYVLAPAAAGHGYATEATAAVLDVGFAAGMHRIVARADARNTASVAVMRRLGMRQEAWFRSNEHVKGEWTDEVVHALLAEEHAARHVR